MVLWPWATPWAWEIFLAIVYFRGTSHRARFPSSSLQRWSWALWQPFEWLSHFGWPSLGWHFTLFGSLFELRLWMALMSNSQLETRRTVDERVFIWIRIRRGNVSGIQWTYVLEVVVIAPFTVDRLLYYDVVVCGPSMEILWRRNFLKML